MAVSSTTVLAGAVSDIEPGGAASPVSPLRLAFAAALLIPPQACLPTTHTHTFMTSPRLSLLSSLPPTPPLLLPFPVPHHGALGATAPRGAPLGAATPTWPRPRPQQPAHLRPHARPAWPRNWRSPSPPPAAAAGPCRWPSLPSRLLASAAIQCPAALHAPPAIPMLLAASALPLLCLLPLCLLSQQRCTPCVCVGLRITGPDG